MNLAQMREEKVSDQLLEACRIPYLEFPDQDALNQVCHGHIDRKVKELPTLKVKMANILWLKILYQYRNFENKNNHL